MVKIVGKCSTSEEQIIDRIKKGAHNLELYLYEEDVFSAKSIKKVLNTLEDTRANVRIVHMPQDKRYKLEGLFNPENMDVYRNTFALANAISIMTKKFTVVILHSHLSVNQMDAWGMYKPIRDKLTKILEEYPNIYIAFENEPAYLSDGGTRLLNDNYFNEIPLLVRRLRRDIWTERIGAMLDVAHARMSVELIDSIRDKGFRYPKSLKDYFVQYHDVLVGIHLSYGEIREGLGEGLPFETEAEIETLKEIIGYIKAVRYDGLLTIEIFEDDYENAVYFERTKAQVEELLN